MSFTSKSGTCRFRGPVGIATPYVQTQCFQPAYVSATESSGSARDLNCTQTWASTGACYYDQECNNIDGKCASGMCGTYYSNNPRVVRELSPGEVSDYCQNAGNCDIALGDEVLLVSYLGENHVVVPIQKTYHYRNDPQCATCLKTVWACNRFKASGNHAAYRQCKKFESCFLYDIVRPDGTMIPVGLKLTPECVACGRVALTKCANNCGNCMPFDSMARLQGGPHYAVYDQ